MHKHLLCTVTLLAATWLPSHATAATMAKADEVRALAAAKLTRQVGAACTEAAEDVRDADYQLAVERGDALAGDAKPRCVDAAKATKARQAAQAASAVAAMKPATVPVMPVAKKEKKGGC